jgi:hypothetical protein
LLINNNLLIKSKKRIKKGYKRDLFGVRRIKNRMSDFYLNPYVSPYLRQVDQKYIFNEEQLFKEITNDYCNSYLNYIFFDASSFKMLIKDKYTKYYTVLFVYYQDKKNVQKYEKIFQIFQSYYQNEVIPFLENYVMEINSLEKYISFYGYLETFEKNIYSLIYYMDKDEYYKKLSILSLKDLFYVMVSNLLKKDLFVKKWDFYKKNHFYCKGKSFCSYLQDYEKYNQLYTHFVTYFHDNYINDIIIKRGNLDLYNYDFLTYVRNEEFEINRLLDFYGFIEKERNTLYDSFISQICDIHHFESISFHKNCDYMSDIYKYIIKMKKVDIFAKVFYTYMKNDLVKECEHKDIYIEYFFDKYLEYNEMCVLHFENNIICKKEIENVYKYYFEKMEEKSVISENKNKIVLFDFIKYFDKLLKKDSSIPYDKIAITSKFHIMYHCNNKDVFIENYHYAMCRRLLSGKSNNIENEKLFVDVIKSIFGSVKMESLLIDYINSESVKDEYEKYSYVQRIQNKIEYIPRILCHSFWNTYLENQNMYKIPAEIRKYEEDFEKYYKTKFQKRKLMYDYMNSKATIRGIYQNNVVYEFEMNALQAILLIALSKSNKMMTLQECFESTQIPIVYLKYICHSMSEKIKILNIKDGKYGINSEFKSQHRRVVFPQLIFDQFHQKEELKEKSDDHIVTQRKNIIQSIIIRMMKSRKSMDHNSLYEEVCKNCTLFVPDKKFIKSEIESLIEREYIKRCENDPNMYIYIS